jgi:hypothetical protein
MELSVYCSLRNCKRLSKNYCFANINWICWHDLLSENVFGDKRKTMQIAAVLCILCRIIIFGMNTDLFILLDLLMLTKTYVTCIKNYYFIVMIFMANVSEYYVCLFYMNTMNKQLYYICIVITCTSMLLFMLIVNYCIIPALDTLNISKVYDIQRYKYIQTDKKVCPICFSKIKTGDIIYRKHICMHSYHYYCLQDWWRISNNFDCLYRCRQSQ